jgi:hypothetical protein
MRTERQLKCSRLDFPGVSRRRFQFGDAVIDIKTHYRDCYIASEIEDLITTAGRGNLFFNEGFNILKEKRSHFKGRARRQFRRML